MVTNTKERITIHEELLDEIQRRISYLLSSDEYSDEEKEVIMLGFLKSLEGKCQNDQPIVRTK